MISDAVFKFVHISEIQFHPRHYYPQFLMVPIIYRVIQNQAIIMFSRHVF